MAQEGSNTFFSPILMLFGSPLETTNTWDRPTKSTINTLIGPCTGFLVAYVVFLNHKTLYSTIITAFIFLTPSGSFKG